MSSKKSFFDKCNDRQRALSVKTMRYACAWEGWPRKKGYLHFLKLITKLHLHFLLHLCLKKS